MKLLNLVAGCALLLSGCVTDVSSESPFREQVGKTQKLRRVCRLQYSLNENEHEKGIHYTLHERDGGNSWRKEGWVPVGTEVRLTAVKRYATDGRGTWFGAIGTLKTPEEGEVTFLYTWSSGSYLERAPWEGEEVPEKRPFWEW